MKEKFDIKLAEKIQKMFCSEFIKSKHKVDKLVTTITTVAGFERILSKLELEDQAAFMIKLINRLYTEGVNYNNKLGNDIIDSQTFVDWSEVSQCYMFYSPKKENDNEKETTN